MGKSRVPWFALAVVALSAAPAPTQDDPDARFVRLRREGVFNLDLDRADPGRKLRSLADQHVEVFFSGRVLRSHVTSVRIRGDRATVRGVAIHWGGKAHHRVEHGRWLLECHNKMEPEEKAKSWCVTRRSFEIAHSFPAPPEVRIELTPAYGGCAVTINGTSHGIVYAAVAAREADREARDTIRALVAEWREALVPATIVPVRFISSMRIEHGQAMRVCRLLDDAGLDGMDLLFGS